MINRNYPTRQFLRDWPHEYGHRSFNLTYNVHPEDYCESNIDLYYRDMPYLLRSMRKIASRFHLWAESNKSGIIHFHAYFQVKDKVAFKKFHFKTTNSMSFNKISLVTDTLGDRDWETSMKMDNATFVRFSP